MKKLLGLPIAINLPKYTQILINLGFILFFFGLSVLLTLTFRGELQNPEKPTTFTTFLLASSIGLVVQHIARVIANRWIKVSYLHWSNGVFILLTSFILYLVITETWGL